MGYPNLVWACSGHRQQYKLLNLYGDACGQAWTFKRPSRSVMWFGYNVKPLNARGICLKIIEQEVVTSNKSQRRFHKTLNSSAKPSYEDPP